MFSAHRINRLLDWPLSCVDLDPVKEDQQSYITKSLLGWHKNCFQILYVPLLHMKPAPGLILGVENTSSPTDLDLYFNQLQGISRSIQQMCRLCSFDLQFINLNGWLCRLVFAPPSCMVVSVLLKHVGSTTI
jgi:hypothetical protein